MLALMRDFLDMQQQQEKGFLAEIRGLTASLLQPPQPARVEAPQPTDLSPAMSRSWLASWCHY